MQKITPFLWFDGNAEEAMLFYTSIFPHAKVNNVVRLGPNGAVMTAAFELEGLAFTALNGGPQFKFTEAVSFVVHCETQDEVDMYWEKLSAGGTPSQCGWLKDKFGLSWQIVPNALITLLSSKDPQTSQRVMQAMMKMAKIEIKKLEDAAAG